MDIAKSYCLGDPPKRWSKSFGIWALPSREAFDCIHDHSLWIVLCGTISDCQNLMVSRCSKLSKNSKKIGSPRKAFTMFVGVSGKASPRKRDFQCHHARWVQLHCAHFCVRELGEDQFLKIFTPFQSGQLQLVVCVFFRIVPRSQIPKYQSLQLEIQSLQGPLGRKLILFWLSP